MLVQSQTKNDLAPGNMPWALLAGAGILGFVITAWLCRIYLLTHGAQPKEASLQALIAALALELIWLPLMGAVFVAEAGRGVREILVSAAAVLFGGGVFCLVTGLALPGFFWAQALVTAFACMVMAAGHFPVRLGLRPDFARARIAVLTLLLVSLPLWSMPALDWLGGSAGGGMLHRLVTWFSPLALIGLPFDGFDLATTGCMYSVMRGPVVPYPLGTWMVVLVYTVLAGGAFAVPTLLKSCFISPK